MTGGDQKSKAREEDGLVVPQIAKADDDAQMAIWVDPAAAIPAGSPSYSARGSSDRLEVVVPAGTKPLV